MKNLIISLLITGITTIAFAQDKTNVFEVVIDDAEVLDINNKYLDAIGLHDAAIPVKMLAKKVATYDLMYSTFLKADYEKEEYYVQFKIPEGEILAIYDNEGEIIRTSEKFKDISLPLAVSNAIVEKYPGWRISSDIYRVSYVKDGKLNKTYKLFIEKRNVGKKVIKTDENGKFI